MEQMRADDASGLLISSAHRRSVGCQPAYATEAQLPNVRALRMLQAGSPSYDEINKPLAAGPMPSTLDELDAKRRSAQVSRPRRNR